MATIYFLAANFFLVAMATIFSLAAIVSEQDSPYLHRHMMLAVDIAAHLRPGPKGRTIVLVSLILLGLVPAIPFPPSDPVAAPPLASSAIVPWTPPAVAPTAIDGHKAHFRSGHQAPFLTVLPNPSPLAGLRTVIAYRLTSSWTSALCGLTLPARVQADL